MKTTKHKMLSVFFVVFFPVLCVVFVFFILDSNNVHAYQGKDNPCNASEFLTEPLDVRLFIDTTYNAKEADLNNPPFRSQLTHMIADLLLIDGWLRGVENHLSIWVYADRPHRLFDDLMAVNEDTISIIHSKIDTIDYDEHIHSKVDFKALFDEIGEQVKHTPYQPLVFLINDMTPNGIQNENDYASTAHDQWIQNQPLNGKKARIYLIDFGYEISSIDIIRVQDRWKRNFFQFPGEPIGGGFRAISDDNKLYELSRIFEETTFINFDTLTSSPPSLVLCPFTEQVKFALVFSDPYFNEVGIEDLIPSPTSKRTRGEYGVVSSIKPESTRLSLVANDIRQDLDVLFAYRAIGGIPDSICPPPKVAAGSYVSVMWPGDSSLDRNLTLRYKPKGSEEFTSSIAGPSPQWQRIGPMPLDIIEETTYELSIESESPENNILCYFDIVPTPKLEILSVSDLQGGKHFTATVLVTYGDRLVEGDEPIGKLTQIHQADSANDKEIELTPIDKEWSESSIIYTYYLSSDENFVESPEEWSFSSELVTKTKDDIDISLRDEYSVISIPEITHTIVPTIYVGITFSPTDMLTQTHPDLSGTLPLYLNAFGTAITVTSETPVLYVSNIVGENILNQVVTEVPRLAIGIMLLGTLMLLLIVIFLTKK